MAKICKKGAGIAWARRTFDKYPSPLMRIWLLLSIVKILTTQRELNVKRRNNG